MIDVLLPYVMLAAGLVLLAGGAEILVKGAVAIANRLHISPLVVGLTIVAMGTSLPELVVCVRAALAGAPGLAIGNVVGSNIANILLILGVGAAIFPIAHNPRHFTRDAILLLAATGLAVALMLTGEVGRLSGAILFAGLLAFLGYSYVEGKKHGLEDLGLIDTDAADVEDDMPGWRMAAYVIGGLIGVAVGAEILVQGSTEIARRFGVSEEVIGLTMVAFGTSLPELATSIAAAMRRATDVALGNIIGSNIFNLLGILGVTAMVTPVPVAEQVVRFDLWFMVAVTVALIPLMKTRGTLERIEGGLFVLAYCAYVAVQFIGVHSLFGAA